MSTSLVDLSRRVGLTLCVPDIQPFPLGPKAVLFAFAVVAKIVGPCPASPPQTLLISRRLSWADSRKATLPRLTSRLATDRSHFACSLPTEHSLLSNVVTDRHPTLPTPCRGDICSSCSVLLVARYGSPTPLSHCTGEAHQTCTADLALLEFYQHGYAQICCAVGSWQASQARQFCQQLVQPAEFGCVQFLI